MKLKNTLVMSGAALALTAIFAGCGTNEAPATVPAVMTEPAAPAATEPAATTEPEAESGISRAVADSITDGMTKDEVQALIGLTPSSTTESEFMGTTTEMVQWLDGLHNSITVMFTNGEASSVTFMDLTTMAAIREALTTEHFEQLSNGMTVDEVRNVMGVAPTSETSMDIAGTEMATLMWVADDGRGITVTFMNGEASSITQIGL